MRVRLRVSARAANTARPMTTASSRYFSIAMSPIRKAPRSAVGRARVICSGPHTTLRSCSATIRPPVVTRICFRCWP